MPEVVHRQFDELPVHDLVLGFDTAQASWPALNPTDKITMVVTRSGTPFAVPLTIVDQAARTVRWTPDAPAFSVSGEDTFVVRVTQADGKSYTHPERGSWTLIIESAAGGVDIADPA